MAENDHASRTPNRLVHEKSPYLQQHAYNPVDWYPWGEEAFEKARSEGKAIFLSIGYSTCHWCHVMERESFEVEETARLMNELFVNIKVDREERPDVDQVYMTAAQALTGSGGWPLSAWLTLDLQPFYVGTYFPPRPAYGRPSFKDVLLSLHEAWTSQRDKVVGSAAAITQAIAKHSVVVESEDAVEISFEIIDNCYRQLEQSYDPRHGGFGQAPKFPRPSIFEFLLRYYKERGSEKALEMTRQTLRKMSAGGMFDQLGGGFARYSVDAEWRVPHFEKMLYDQGQLLAVLADVVRITGDSELAGVIRQTVEYLQRDLQHPDGAFYSAEDADSEGEEGVFYVWTLDELRGHLDERQLEAVRLYYGVTSDGNFEHGRNVLHTSATLDDVAKLLETTPEEARAVLETARARLFDVRTRRIRPHRDEKILAAWNGLMISGLARAASALNDLGIAAVAARAADSILTTMVVDGRLKHRVKEGEVRIEGFLEDYAFLAAGLIDLYEATFELRYLKEADRLVREANTLFYDEKGGGYFMTAGEDPTVLIRSKSDHDGAEPSGNSVMAMNLLRLGRLFHDDELIAMAERTIRMFTTRVATYPMMMPLMVAAAVALEHPPRQIVIAASEDADNTRRLIEQVRGAYLPDTALVLVGADGPDPWLAERIETLEGMGPVGGKAAAFVCEDLICHAPVTEWDEHKEKSNEQRTSG